MLKSFIYWALVAVMDVSGLLSASSWVLSAYAQKEALDSNLPASAVTIWTMTAAEYNISAALFTALTVFLVPLTRNLAPEPDLDYIRTQIRELRESNQDVRSLLRRVREAFGGN